jgi:hypothetical protein
LMTTDPATTALAAPRWCSGGFDSIPIIRLFGA